MIVNDYGFNTAPGSLPGKISGATALPKERSFILEGCRDIYHALPLQSSRGKGEGPIYPTIGTKLFPALDALETTFGQLGKHPSPEEVDRSNVRRLIRAFQPVAKAFSSAYEPKEFKQSMKHIQRLASSLGKYKDVAVIEEQARGVSPGGVIPKKMQNKLDKLRQKRRDEFKTLYKEFRKDHLKSALKVLSRPRGLNLGDPQQILRQDRRLIAHQIHQLAEDVKATGLLHQDPDKFHKGRKSLRNFLNCVQSAKDSFSLDSQDIDSATELVNTYGVAQDNHIAGQWLRENRFDDHADRIDQLFQQHQNQALDQARGFLESGAIERIQAQIS